MSAISVRNITHGLIGLVLACEAVLFATFASNNVLEYEQVKGDPTGQTVPVIPDYADNVTLVLLSGTAVDVVQWIFIGALVGAMVLAAFGRRVGLLASLTAGILVAMALLDVALFEIQNDTMPLLAGFGLILTVGTWVLSHRKVHVVKPAPAAPPVPSPAGPGGGSGSS